jgi:ABC-type transport system involved in cytochrome c biogenesis ATPase subunit
LIRAESLAFAYPGASLFRDLSFVITPGLTLVRGGDGRGKSTLLRLMAGVQQPQAGTLLRHAETLFWGDPTHPDEGHVAGLRWLSVRRERFPAWNRDLEAFLVDELGLLEHIDKPLYMLSTGSRRKVGLVAAFSSGAHVSLLDVPFAALDGSSSRVLAELLAEAAGHDRRAWVVADFELPASLAGVALSATIDLGD